MCPGGYMFNASIAFETFWSLEKPGINDTDDICLIVRSGGDFLIPDQQSGETDALFAPKSNLPACPVEWPVCRIGNLGETPVTLIMAPADTASPEGCSWVNPRPFLVNLDSGRIGAVSRASMLATWNNDHRFCGRCGEPTVMDNREPARVCPACSHRSYPRVSPAMIVRIIASEKAGFNKPHILLAHNARFPEGLYSCVAGFVDPGESVERTVIREIKEEVNLDAEEPAYIRSQAWPFPHSLMLGFETTAAGTPQPDGLEITDAAWFSYDSLPEIPRHGTISRFLIDSWLKKISG